MVFVDETGCSLLPAVGRTYAPMGQTPILRAPRTRDHRASIGALTLTGRVLMQGQDRRVGSTDVVRLLNQLLRHSGGTVLIGWDGASIHYGAVQDCLRTAAAQRIVLVRLPSYAPALNPVEGLWHYLKHSELVKVCCRTLAELRPALRTALARVRQRGDVLAGCIRQPGWY